MDQQTADLLTKLAGPVATVLASLTAAGVAIAFGISQSRNAKRQIDIANDKLALELFNKRVEVYQRIHRAVGQISRSGAVNSEVEVGLLEPIEGGRFLFAGEIKAYLEELYTHLLDLAYYNTMLKNPQSLTPSELADASQKRTDHFKAITSFYKNIDKLFGPYLSATHKFSQGWRRW
jgi:hypothetical protein